MSDEASIADLIIDSFAGGGGASTGIERALGRSPDYCINHDREALAMHEANHPLSVHLQENVWKVDPASVTRGRPVFLLWASPDCRHHSKAKGGKPVSRSVRGLADVVILWAKVARPRIILLENVEEFQDWGPLTDAGFPCPARKGTEFARWVRALEAEGYAVEWRELRACDYGAPTIRKRLFVVARRDGLPIVWPARTHGDPKKDGDAIARGEIKPWRTAAGIVDWHLQCPSIFLTRDEAKRQGLSVVRPLADATLARIARGFRRYVLDRAEPFVVALKRNAVPIGVEAPISTVQTSGAHHAIVAPFVSYAQQGGASRAADAPHHTICANAKDQNQVVTGYLVPRYGERTGQDPRCLDAERPLPTVVPTGNGGDLAAVFLAQHNTDMVGHPADAPVSTVVGKGCTQAPVMAYLAGVGGRMGQSGERPVEAPYHTVCTKPDTVIVLPHLTAYYGTGDGQAADAPLRTATTLDRFGHVEAQASPPPLDAERLTRARRVADFLRAHGAWDANADGSRDVVMVGPFVVVDIGMRMLTPRELARAQGFPDDYILAAPCDGRPLTETAQRHKIGNSVCPPIAAALVKANCIDALAMAPVKRRRAALAHLPAPRACVPVLPQMELSP